MPFCLFVGYFPCTQEGRKHKCEWAGIDRVCLKAGCLCLLSPQLFPGAFRFHGLLLQGCDPGGPACSVPPTQLPVPQQWLRHLRPPLHSPKSITWSLCSSDAQQRVFTSETPWSALPSDPADKEIYLPVSSPQSAACPSVTLAISSFTQPLIWKNTSRH